MNVRRYLILALGAVILAGCSQAARPPLTTPALTAMTPPSSATALPTLPLELPTIADVPVDTATTSPAAASTPVVLPTKMSKPTVTLRGTPMQPITSLDTLAQQARTDLAARLGLAAGAVVVIRAEAVEWPDSSLGCPKPGLMYAQVVTPGVLIVLQANGQTYEYHGTMRSVSLCEKKT